MLMGMEGCECQGGKGGEKGMVDARESLRKRETSDGESSKAWNFLRMRSANKIEGKQVLQTLGIESRGQTEEGSRNLGRARHMRESLSPTAGRASGGRASVLSNLK